MNQMNLKIDQQKSLSKKQRKIISKKNEQNFTENIINMNRHAECDISKEREKEAEKYSKKSWRNVLNLMKIINLQT